MTTIGAMEEMVITGMGALTPFGLGLEPQRKALEAGARALKASQLEDGLFAAEIAAPVKSFVKRKGLAPLSRAAQLTVAAVQSLLAEREGSTSEEEIAEYALVVGTAFGNLESKTRFHLDALRDGPELVSPMVFPNTIINSLAGHAAILFRIRGPNSTVTSGRRSGLEALLRAASLLRAERAPRAIVAACDEVALPLVRGLAVSEELCLEDPEGPSASEPYARGSSGIYPGEGAVALFLESATQVAASGRTPMVRLRGWREVTTVGRSLSVAVGDSLRGALESGNSEPNDVSWIALSGCGSRELDEVEAAAVREVFGGRDKPAAAIKSTFGETFGAAGLLACMAAAVCLADGIVPATPGYRKGELTGLSAETRAAPPGPVLVSTLDSNGAVAVLIGD